MRFASLGSGSEGNGLVVEVARTRLLLDCGFTLRGTLARLGRLGLEAEHLAGVLVTHEHDDHIGGVARLARRFGIPVWVTHGTRRAVAESHWDGVDLRPIEGYGAFAVGDIEVRPYPVPHDAREPAQFAFSDGAVRLAVLTDAGCSTPHIEATLSGCEALMLECNHDAAMLAGGTYPPALKQRIAGRLGHLANDAAADLLARLDRSRLRHVVAAHLSQSNNRPELAREALAEALGCSADWVAVADQHEGLDWRQVA